MARRRQARPAQARRKSPPPPSAAALAAGGIIGGAPPAAAGAAALATGAEAQKDVVANTVTAILSLLAAIHLRRRRIIRSRASQAFPASDIEAEMEEEERREIVFRKRVEQRLRTGMKLAQAATDPSARAAAIQALMLRERRFAEMRSAAAGERVLAAAELQDLRTRSPQGAFWTLGLRRIHTPDCIAMAGKFWPWPVLNEVHPLLHTGCGCRLYSFGQAIAQAMMTADGVPSTQDALRMAAPVIQHVREERDEAERRFAHLSESADEELLIRAALLDRGAADPNILAAAPLRCDTEMNPPADVLEEADQEHNTGAMVALYPPSALAKKLALEGGLKPEELHVTLAFLGTAEDLDQDKARAAVAAWAKKAPKLSGELSGIGHFHISGRTIVTYRSVDLPDLPTPREELVKALDAAGVPPSRDHGFIPHMTLDERVRRPKIEKQSIAFGSVFLVWGEEREEFKLTGRASKK